MAVLRRLNIISQQRIDVPDLREFESAASNDFDDLIQSVVTGTTQGYVLRGFEISMAGAVGGAASGLQVIVDPGSILHITSSQSGTFFLVPTGTAPQQLNSAINTIVTGSFVPNAINYIGIEYNRFVDDTTDSEVYIWDPTTNTEDTLIAPRAQVLEYTFVITTTAWAPNVLPMATVTTDAGNNVVSIQDSRFMLFRLGQGGASPNPFYVYPWTAQPEGRTENPSSSSSNSINPFEGGDKMLGTLKDWMDAVMSAFLEIKGTTYWYSLSSSGSLYTLREDLGNTVITGRGHISHSATTAGLINWDQDIFVRVIGSQLAYRLIANPSSTDITLADDEAAYITLVRGVLVIPNLIFTNGSAVVASVGLVAWTTLLLPGDFVKLASDTDAGYYQILSVDSSSQVTLTSNFIETSTGAPGAQAKYAFGSYQASASPSTSRDIYLADRSLVPEGENVFWLFLRSDNTGVVPRVYIRFLGSELQQGETEEISDNTPIELLQYVGSPIQSAYLPQYVSALNPGSVPQITDITIGSAATITSNQYFIIYASGNSRTYYVWFNKDGTGVDPMPAGTNASIQVAITTGQTATQVASALSAAFNASPNHDFSSVAGVGTVTVTNTSAGACTNAFNFNVGAPFAITIGQSGTGVGNFIIHDGDNLTLAIKELDQAFAGILENLGDVDYDETVDIVASGATPPISLNGPISASTLITLPNNSRLSDAPQTYIVGRGVLEVYLNGVFLRLNDSWAEVGADDSSSNQIEILTNLVVDDYLEFRITGTGLGGGEEGPPGPAGPAGAPGVDALNGPIPISTKTSSYTVLLSDGFLLANCTSGSITFTLPAAASAPGKVFYFKKIDSTSNAMTIMANGIELIDGSNTITEIVQYEEIGMVSDSTQWWLF